MYGWNGQILRINLTEEVSNKEEIEKSILEDYIGGRGLGAYLLSQEVPPESNPLGEESKMILAVGPLTRTKTPTSGRMSISTKSPLTNTIFDSNGGGFFGASLKGAGYDAIILEGESKRPLSISITEEGAVFHDASNLWGKGIQESQSMLIKEHGKAFQSLIIGPAGENLVKFSSISINGNRSLGRGGVGAVLGQKKVKSISVRGSKETAIYSQERFDFINYEAQKWLKASPLTSMALPTFGTSMLVNLINEAGLLPTKNFQLTQFEGASAIAGETLKKTILLRNEACYRCPLRCSRRTKTERGEGHGPEYETIGLLGSNLGIGDIRAIAELNYLCNDLGLDTISSGGTISCLMEMAERNLLDYPISFGDVESVEDLLKKIAYRQDIGDELAEGSRAFAKQYNASEYAMEVKGLELPSYDPRGMKGQGLGYITSNRGACHLRANMLGPEVLGLPKMMDRFASQGKSGILINLQNFNAIIDSFVVCKFLTFAIGEEFFARLLSAVTGVERSQQDLLDIGERIWNLERIYNLRAGFTRKDDALPQRFKREFGSGPCSKEVFEEESMLEEYYRSRGWDREGAPTEEKAKRLGLGGVL